MSSGNSSGNEPSAMSGPVFFRGDQLLEGILEWPETEGARGGPGQGGMVRGGVVPGGMVRGGVVLAHPHPLHGATMAQPVIYRTAQACRDAGFATLRFNFRGVGKSEGVYSGKEEYRDVVAAAAYLREQLRTEAEDLPLVAAGYSFGSVMTALAAPLVKPEALVLIGFVVESDLFSPLVGERLRGFPGPVLAVCGEGDEMAPPIAVRRTLEELGLDYRLVVVKGTDHFFVGKQRAVGEAVASFLVSCFPPRLGLNR